MFRELFLLTMIRHLCKNTPVMVGRLGWNVRGRQLCLGGTRTISEDHIHYVLTFSETADDSFTVCCPCYLDILIVSL